MGKKSREFLSSLSRPQRLLVTLLATFTALGVLMGWLNLSEKRHLTSRDALKRQHQITGVVARSLEQRFDSQARLVRTIFNGRGFKQRLQVLMKEVEAVKGVGVYEQELHAGLGGSFLSPRAHRTWRRLHRSKGHTLPNPFHRVLDDEDLVFFDPNGGKPLIRQVVPLDADYHARILDNVVVVVDMDYATFVEEMNLDQRFFTYVVDRFGRALAQSLAKHFEAGEDLSHLPIVRSARGPAASGDQRFFELPGDPLQSGAFQNLPKYELTVVTQMPASQMDPSSGLFVAKLAMVFFFCVLLLVVMVYSAYWTATNWDELSLDTEIRKKGPSVEGATPAQEEEEEEIVAKPTAKKEEDSEPKADEFEDKEDDLDDLFAKRKAKGKEDSKDESKEESEEESKNEPKAEAEQEAEKESNEEDGKKEEAKADSEDDAEPSAEASEEKKDDSDSDGPEFSAA